jgi:sec-independent protein translocase protein TatC
MQMGHFMATTDTNPPSSQQEDEGFSFLDRFEDNKDDGNGAQMTLVEHLGELRRRLFVCVIAVLITTIVAFIFHDPILHFLLTPLPKEANAITQGKGDAKLVVTGIGEGFSVALKMSLAVGIALASPIWIYEIWGFLAPAMTRKEKKYAFPFTLIGVILFIAGIAVGFAVLRYPISFLIDFGSGSFVELITADNYFSFVSFFLLAFGIVFELPLVLTFMALIGLVSSKWLSQNRSYILVALWIISCFITPGADPYSPIIISVAFTALYFVAEILIRIIRK